MLSDNFIILLMLNLSLLMSSLIFSQLKHPLAMGFLLLIQTTLISLISGLMINSFRFSYILFLVFLGGMLVLFIYVTSLASNEMFNFSMKLLFITGGLLFMFILSANFVDFTKIPYIYNYEIYSSKFSLNLLENLKSIYKLYSFPTSLITCLMINYLLFTLIVAVKITSFFYGPIRNMK